MRPKLHIVRIVAAWLFAALALAGCRQKPVLLRLYYTTDVAGYVTPCG